MKSVDSRRARRNNWLVGLNESIERTHIYHHAEVTHGSIYAFCPIIIGVAVKKNGAAY